MSEDVEVFKLRTGLVADKINSSNRSYTRECLERMINHVNALLEVGVSIPVVSSPDVRDVITVKGVELDNNAVTILISSFFCLRVLADKGVHVSAVPRIAVDEDDVARNEQGVFEVRFAELVAVSIETDAGHGHI